MSLGYVYKDICVGEDRNIQVSKLGGKPIWPGEPPSADLRWLSCQSCEGPLSLVLQLNTESKTAGVENRFIYVFVCRGVQCSNLKSGWTAIRAVTKRMPILEKRNQDLFSKQALNKCNRLEMEGEIEKLLQNSVPQRAKPPQNDTKDLEERMKKSLIMDECCYPAFLLEFHEEIQKEDSYEHEKELLLKYERSMSEKIYEYEEKHSRKKANEWEGEKYEKDPLSRKLKFLSKFQQYLSLNPTQCVRYALDNRPVFYSDPKIDGIDSGENSICPFCMNTRVFEFQIMPNSITYLSKSFSLKTENTLTSSENPKVGLINLLRSKSCLDFGTILVYTCMNNCSDPSNLNSQVQYTKEFIVAQIEESLK